MGIIDDSSIMCDHCTQYNLIDVWCGDCVERKVEELASDLATAQAQVAVMAEAMTDVIECRGRGDAWAGERLRQALSAAPKVVWSGDATVNKCCGLALPLEAYKALKDRRYTKVDLVVLDKGEGE